MKLRKIKPIQKLTAWFFCLAILSQNAVESPVLCLEADGHINIEAGCDIACKIPVQKNDGHQDTCDDCIDISFWNYNPDLTFHLKSFDDLVNVIQLKWESNFHEILHDYRLDFTPVEYLLYSSNTYLKNSILLV